MKNLLMVGRLDPDLPRPGRAIEKSVEWRKTNITKTACYLHTTPFDVLHVLQLLRDYSPARMEDRLVRQRALSRVSPGIFSTHISVNASDDIGTGRGGTLETQEDRIGTWHTIGPLWRENAADGPDVRLSHLVRTRIVRWWRRERGRGWGWGGRGTRERS